MTRSIYISGIIALNLFMFGALFKILHWPGAGWLIIFGIVTFSCWSLPAALINNFRNSGKKHTWIYITVFISVFIDLIGAMFKIQHWTGAGWFILVGVPLPFVLFLPVYIYHNIKHKWKTKTDFFYVMFIMIYITVYSVLLAMNISKQVVSAFVLNDDRFVEIKEYYEVKNDIIYDRLLENEDGEAGARLVIIRKSADDICEYIEDIKYALIRETGQLNEVIYSTDSVIDLWKVTKMDNSEIPRKILIGKEKSGKVYELKNKIERFAENFVSGIKDEAIKNNIHDLLSTSDIKIDDGKGHGYTVPWEEFCFKNNYLVVVYMKLSEIQSNVRLAESVLITAI